MTTEVAKPADSNELSVQILQELKLLNKYISKVSKRQNISHLDLYAIILAVLFTFVKEQSKKIFLPINFT